MSDDVTAVTDVTDSRRGVGTRSDGERLLDDVHEFITRFVALPAPEAADAITAWVIHTWALDGFDTTPRLACLSPEPGSGKTRILEVLELLTPHPMMTFNVSAAVLFRSMTLQDESGSSRRPTVMLDEADTIFGPRASRDHEDLRGFINAGYRRGANAQRAVIRGKSVEIETFPAFAAVAIAGLDDLPDTVMTRSIVIRMRRRAPHEHVAPFRRRVYLHEGRDLSERIDAWVGYNCEALSDFVEVLPIGIEDRNADIWEPLISIGDAAGPEWSERIRAAAQTLVGASQSTGETLGIRLLADLKQVFGDRDRLSTIELLHALNELEESPWGDLRGKPLDARGLSNRLRRYGVKPKPVRVGSEVVKGYAAEDLHDPWGRYLPAPLRESVTSVTAVTPEVEPATSSHVAHIVTQAETADYGPCTLCGQPTRRYGENATGPLCAACQTVQVVA